MNKATFRKFIKFGLVGFSGVFIDYGSTYVFKEFFFWDKYVANSFGFMLAASSNYYFNRIWTFNSNNPKMLIEYLLFVSIAVVGLILNNSIIWLLSDYIFSLNFYLSKFFAIGMVSCWNFLMNHLFTFKENTGVSAHVNDGQP